MCSHWLKLNLLVRNHQANWIVTLQEIFKISTNQNTLWALAAMLDFRSVPKTKILYMTIQWTFLPSLIQICFVLIGWNFKNLLVRNH
jgi:hypothetical protein